MRFSAILLLTTLSTALAGNLDQTKIRTAATRAQTTLEAVERTWQTIGYCYSCHNDAMAVHVAKISREHGIPVDENLALKEARKAYSWMNSAEEAALGDYFVDPALVDGIELVSAKEAGYPATFALQAYARRIARLQLGEGNWISSDRRPPQSHSAWSATAYSLAAIRDYLPPELTVQKQQVLSKGKHWLLTQTPQSTEDRAMQLWGLTAAGATENELKTAAAALLQDQRPDGGWAQTATRTSDAYATGQVLSALHDSAVLTPEDPRYQKGLQYLLNTQQPDGTWHVTTRLHTPLNISPPYMETGFPYKKDQFISMLATSWSTVALASALDKVPAAPPQPLLTSSESEQPWVRKALFGSAADLDQLLAGGLSASAKTDKGTPLLLLVASEPEKVKLLIARGADVSTRESRYHFTALMVAASYTGTTESVRLLLQAGAKTAKDEPDLPEAIPSAGFISTGTGEVEKTRLLLEHGENPNRIWRRPGLGTYTYLGNAIDMHDEAMVRYLVKTAHVDVNDPANKIPALVRAVTSNLPDLVKTLLDLGADVNWVDKFGLTPLHYAAMTDFGDQKVIQILLANGAQRDKRGKDGRTALEIARQFGHARLAQELQGKEQAQLTPEPSSTSDKSRP
jgi:N-acyl-D-amino-acid deacylase